jgi:hypothetical protein
VRTAPALTCLGFVCLIADCAAMGVAREKFVAPSPRHQPEEAKTFSSSSMGQGTRLSECMPTIRRLVGNSWSVVVVCGSSMPSLRLKYSAQPDAMTMSSHNDRQPTNYRDMHTLCLLSNEHHVMCVLHLECDESLESLRVSASGVRVESLRCQRR